VAVKAAVHDHRAFHIHFVAHAKQADVRSVERLAHGRNRIGVALQAHHRQAHTVVGDALINLQLARKGALQGEVYVVEFVLDTHYLGIFFYDSRKHIRQVLNDFAEPFRIPHSKDKISRAHYKKKSEIIAFYFKEFVTFVVVNK
jgi:hypothetical protein